MEYAEQKRKRGQQRDKQALSIQQSAFSFNQQLPIRLHRNHTGSCI